MLSILHPLHRWDSTANATTELFNSLSSHGPDSSSLDRNHFPLHRINSRRPPSHSFLDPSHVNLRLQDVFFRPRHTATATLRQSCSFCLNISSISDHPNHRLRRPDDTVCPETSSNCQIFCCVGGRLISGTVLGVVNPSVKPWWASARLQGI